MTKKELTVAIQAQQSFLCVGLDTQLSRIPAILQSTSNPILAFNKAIIDATTDLCVAYKLNLAFYEAAGKKGWDALEKTLAHIPSDKFVIADAKRGDIGNTASQYAHAFFEQLPFDAITLAPYMGFDAVSPFLSYPGKWSIILALTSNKGHADFQLLKTADDRYVYEKVVERITTWGSDENVMLVVGATRPQDLGHIRKMAPKHFFLVPGVGAQGGSLADVAHWGLNEEVGLLVNSSRGIIFASEGSDFAEQARKKAMSIQTEMASLLNK